MTTFNVIPNSSIGYEAYPNRWKIMHLLGEGTFARVIKAWDRSTRKYVAIKINSSCDEARDNAYREINILDKIRNEDVEDIYSVIKYMGHFKETLKGHICIIMPKLDISLKEYMMIYSPLSDSGIITVTKQIASALHYLHDSLHIIHTDIKPDNIIIDQSDNSIIYPRIRLIDFNLSADVDDSTEPLTGLITTIYYRAPEVILNLEWSYSVDIWSLGCTLFELYTGKPLFPTLTEPSLLKYMCSVLGPLPIALTTLERYRDLGPTITPRLTERLDMIENTDLLDLIERCLVYDKNERIVALDMIKHPFIESE